MNPDQDYSDSGFTQSMGSGLSQSAAAPPSNVQKFLVLGGIIAAVIGLIIFWVILNRGESSATLDQIIVRQENLVAIAETAKDMSDDFTTTQMATNAVVLAKTNISSLNSYRATKFDNKTDEEVLQSAINQTQLEADLKSADQIGNLTEKFIEIYGLELRLSIAGLDNLDTDSAELQQVIAEVRANQTDLQDELASLEASN